MIEKKNVTRNISNKIHINNRKKFKNAVIMQFDKFIYF
jgi:hypothetical protein